MRNPLFTRGFHALVLDDPKITVRVHFCPKRASVTSRTGDWPICGKVYVAKVVRTWAGCLAFCLVVLFSAWNARAASSNGGFKFPILEDFFALNRRIKAVHILSAQFVGLPTRISQRNLRRLPRPKSCLRPSTWIRRTQRLFRFSPTRIESITISVPARTLNRGNCLYA